MKKKMKEKLNSKGFTLVELLAVIVILAVLVMIAMPNVLNIMEDTRKNAFVTEVQEFARQASQAYLNSEMSGNVPSSAKKLTGVAGGKYTYYCITVQGLVDEGYVKKSNINDYSGIIEMLIPTSTASKKQEGVVVNVSNKSYVFNEESLFNLENKSYNISSGAAPTRSACYTSTSGLDESKTLNLWKKAYNENSATSVS